MKLSVVILNWNGRRHLEHFLPSVVEHSLKMEGVEVVIADNNSTDDSLLWLALNYPTLRIVRLEQNYGFAGGYNRALKQIESDYYLLLNNDVEVSDGWLAPLIEVLDKESDVAAGAPKLLSANRRNEFEYAGASGGFIDYLGYPFCRGRILSTLEQDCGQYDTRRDIFWGSGAALCCRAELFHALASTRSFLLIWKRLIYSGVCNLPAGVLSSSPDRLSTTLEVAHFSNRHIRYISTTATTSRCSTNALHPCSVWL